jgi:hypothetical protein
MSEPPQPPARRGRSLKILALIAGAALAAAACLLLTSSEKQPVRVGESLDFAVYAGGTKIGTLSERISESAVVENASCYVARYTLTVGGSARAGVLKFDGEGRLRRAVVAQAENLSLRWRTEVGYSFSQGLMRVIVQDNRDPENYRENDLLVRFGSETVMLPEHVWYFLRFQPLGPGYRRELYLNLLPDAALNVRAALRVTGEERVETPAGRFSCWVLEGENTGLAPWPIDRIWVSKDRKIVVKAVEWVNGVQCEYVLEKLS